MDCTILVAKTKALISLTVTAKLICAFVFAYAKSRFSHDAAHILNFIFFYYPSSFQSKEVILSKERLITPNTLSTLYKGITFSSLVEPW